jgi:hypothetical protein
VYCLYDTIGVDKNPQKAKQLYQMALNIDSKENDIVMDRLKMLDQIKSSSWESTGQQPSPLIAPFTGIRQ